LAAGPDTVEWESKGLRRIAVGAGLGVAGGIATVGLPIAFLLLATYNPGGLFTFGAPLIEATSILVIAGAILFILSLFLYRRGFGALRRIDRRFRTPAVLCIVGSLGFLLLLVSAAILFGSSNTLLNCLHGQPSHALSCLRSGTPLGAYTGLAGFWLGWLGGLGVVLGLGTAGRRYHRAALWGGGVLYALLLLALLGPFLALFYTFGGEQYALLVIPFLIVIAPALVFGGTRPLTVSASAPPPRPG